MLSNGRGRRSRVLVIILSTTFVVVAFCSLAAYVKVVPSFSEGSSSSGAGGPAAVGSAAAALVVEGQDGAPPAVRTLAPSSAANEKEATNSRQRLVEWWQSHPSAPIGISCDPTSQLLTDTNDASASTATSMGLPIPPPLFRARSPAQIPATNGGGGGGRIQVAMVVPFVPFQLPKIIHLLSKFWSKHPPCLPDTPKQSADLVFFTESKVADEVKDAIMRHIAELGQVENATSCFNNANLPAFLSLTNVDPELSHLEGAASTFFSLFELLETKYRTFLLAEPDVVPVQAGFVPALVEQSQRLGCGDDDLWQVGSPPLVADVEAGMLRERVDIMRMAMQCMLWAAKDSKTTNAERSTFRRMNAPRSQVVVRMRHTKVAMIIPCIDFGCIRKIANMADWS